MPTTTVDYRVQLVKALREVRVARHHLDCRCCQYRSAEGSPFCTAAEWRWSCSVDRLLRTIERVANNTDLA